jgi:hypothetical protein
MFRLATIMVAAMLLPDAAQAEPMTFRYVSDGGNCVGCEWIAAEGTIKLDTADDFLAFLDREQLAGYSFNVVLNSNGGSMVGAMEFGSLLRRRGHDTLVGRTVPEGRWHTTESGECISACAIAFLGGVSRTAAPDSIGVHQFYDEAGLSVPDEPLFTALDLSSHQLLSALLVDYVFRMGVDPRFVAITSSVPPTSMYFFTVDQLAELKVTWDPGEFVGWRIEPYSRGVVAFTKTRDEKRTATLFCRNDGTPRLLLTDSDITDIDEVRDWLTSLDGISVFGIELPAQAVSAQRAGKLAGIEINMHPHPISSALATGTYEIQGHVPRVFEAPFSYQLAGEGLVESALVAMRNCI